MNTKTIFSLVFMIFAISLTALTNTWTGNTSTLWSADGNWSLGRVPISTDDVVIPTSAPNNPYITASEGYTGNCRTLVIQSGKTLRVGYATINITYDMTNHGHLYFSSANAVINVGDDIFWKNGSTENISQGNIYVKGDWTFEDGCNVTIGTGNTVVFNGSTSQFLYVYDENSYFGNMTVNQSGNVVLWLQNASTYDIHVTGDLTLTNNSKLQVQSTTLTVDGTLDIENGSKMYLEHSGGELINNSDFTMNGEMDIDGGDVLVHGEFDLASTGILTIDGGSFITDDFNNVYGTFNISDGLYHTSNYLRITSSAITNISGGVIRTGAFYAEYIGTFQPSGGAVEIQTANAAHSGIFCSNGNYFHNLNINPIESTYGDFGGGKLSTNITVLNNLEILTGSLWFDGFEASVNNDVNIYGGLLMNNAADILNVGNDIYIFSGSFSSDDHDEISDGTINVSGNWYFNDGTNAQLGTENSVNFVGSGSQLIYNFDDNASFGNVTVNKPDTMPVWLDNSSTHDFQIDGALTLTNNSILQVQSKTLIVDGTLDIENGSKMYLEHVGGELINNSDFDLNGELEIDGGEVLVHGDFNINSSGILSLDSGRFTYDTGVTHNNNIYGTLNISDGIYSAYYSINIKSTANINITGGIYRSRAGLYADTPNTFQPSGGTLEIWDMSLLGSISCADGNYLYNLCIASGDQVNLFSDLTIQNNLNIEGIFFPNSHEVTVNNDIEISGTIYMNNAADILNVGNDITWYSGSTDNITAGTINVSGNWYFNNGTDAQLGTGNTINFVGSGSQLIYNFDDNASFGNVTVNKPDTMPVWLDNSSTHDFQIDGDLTLANNSVLQVQSNTLVVDGTLDIENGSSMGLADSNSELINYSDFTLNGELDVGAGSVHMQGEFQLESTGTLTIAGGSFINDIQINDGWSSLDGIFNLSDGLFEITNNLLSITDNCTANVSGGIMRVGHYFSVYTDAVFQPSGGVVELTSGADVSFWLPEGSYFHDLKIKGFLYAASDVLINNDLYIDVNSWSYPSYLRLNGKEITVINDVNIYEKLWMTSSDDVINVGNDITWFSGSIDDITTGTINVSGDWYFNDGTNAQLGTGNTVNFVGSEHSTVYCYDDNACFGNLVVDKDNITVQVALDSSIYRVSGNLEIMAGKLYLNDGIQLEIGNSITTHAGGIFRSWANINPCIVTKFGAEPYAFNVESWGTIDAESTIFEFMDANGVNIKPDAIIDNSSLFWDCTFQNGAANGTLLTIDNYQDLVLDALTFISNSKDAPYNVTKNVDNGTIQFTNSSGNFDGPDYENDPYNRIDWVGFTAPTVATTAITNIAATTATSGGNVTADGGSSVTARGVCWSTSANPTLADDFTEDGTGTGAFVSSLIGLTQNTTYYVRAYSTNALGTTYGNEVSFTTTTVAPPAVPQNLTIEIVGGNVVLNWAAVSRSRAITYKIYSSDDPNAAFGTWTEEVEVSGTTWSEEIPASLKFYRVTAVE